MEMKKKANHHNKHLHHPHRPPTAYQLYELEHMPHDIGIVKLPSDPPKPHSHKARPSYPETGWEVHSHSRSPRGSNGRIFRPDYYETSRVVRPRSYLPEGVGGGTTQENIDVEAEEFIRSKHNKFELSKWMSMNPK